MYLLSENKRESPGFLYKNVNKSFLKILKIVDFLVALMVVVRGELSYIA